MATTDKKPEMKLLNEQQAGTTCARCGNSMPGSGGIGMQGACFVCGPKDRAAAQAIATQAKAMMDDDDGDDDSPPSAKKPGAKGDPNAKRATMDAAGFKKSGLPPAAQRLGMYGEMTGPIVPRPTRALGPLFLDSDDAGNTDPTGLVTPRVEDIAPTGQDNVTGTAGRDSKKSKGDMVGGQAGRDSKGDTDMFGGQAGRDSAKSGDFFTNR